MFGPMPNSFRWPLVVLLATALAVYLQTITFGFVWDDHLLVVDNRFTGSVQGWIQAFTTDLWAASGDPDPSSGYYRPLFVVDLGLTRLMAGLDPGVHHMHGLAWHLVAIGLAAWLFSTIIPRGWAACAGLALFALHPVQAEAIGFVSARNDPMAAVFLLGALLLLSRDKPNGVDIVGGTALILAAVLAKESVVLAPLLLAVICWSRHGHWGRPGAHLATIAGLALAVGLRSGAGVAAPEQADMAHVLAAAWPTFVHGAARTVWPVDLSPLIHLGWPPALPVAGACIFVVVLVLLALIGRVPALTGLAFAVVTGLPVLAGVAHTGAIVDRYLYLPMLGLSLALAASIDRLFVPRAFFTAATGGLAILTIGQLQIWKNDEVLWKAAMRHAPSGYAAGALARWLEDEGRPQEAAHWYRRAIRMSPRPFQPACYNISRIHLRLSEPRTAVVVAREALEAGCDASPELMAPLAVALAATGDWNAAEQVANQIEQDPTGKAIVVRIAASARRGNYGPLRAATEASGGERSPQLIGQVIWLVEQSGDVKRAEDIRAAFQ